MVCRGIRGATTAEANTREAILGATRELLEKLVLENGLDLNDVACAVFSTTRDLNAEFPAAAARQLGWGEIALLCGHEMDVPDAMKGVIRVMVLVNTDKKPKDLVNVYLKETYKLRQRVASENGRG